MLILVLPVARQAGLDVLFRLQVTARSMLGPLALNCALAEAERQPARLPPGSPPRVTITGSPGREDSPG